MKSPTEKLIVERHDKVLVIKFNNTRKRNALDLDCYSGLAGLLKNAGQDDSITVVVLTGVGDFYSSGNDITARMPDPENDFDAIIKDANQVLRDLIQIFIRFPKILIAVVNGPCIGIAATTAALCDVVYCSDKAYFLTPFSLRGLVPEGCSTYTFPRILGQSKAMEMLLLNYKLSSDEALRFNFVSDVYEMGEYETKIWPKIVGFSKLMPKTLKSCKALVKKFEIEPLERAMDAEMEALSKCYQSEDFFTSMMDFISKKSKL